MTRNQIDALRLQEEKRHNEETEAVARKELTPTFLRGIGSFITSVTGKGGVIGGFKPGRR